MFNINKYEKNYFIFPNVPWDRSIAMLGGKVAFEDVYKWISYTIELFKDKPKLQLIIKIHPAEAATGRSEKTMLDYINEKYPNLPNNIKTIPPKTDIDPYSLFPFIDVGIVCNGTIGLEMSLKNIPVVVTGKVHYTNNGFTHDVSTEKEYSDILMSNISPLKNQQTLAKIYAYFYFIKSFIPRKYLYYKNFLNLGWKINSFDDFAPGKDKHLDHICDYILNDGVYQNW
jgi:capsule polysaccharide export protein KpsC/LpsZ